LSPSSLGRARHLAFFNARALKKKWDPAGSFTRVDIFGFLQRRHVERSAMATSSRIVNAVRGGSVCERDG